MRFPRATRPWVTAVIYVGDGKMIHAPRPGKSVEVVQLQGAAYYESMSWAIKRYANVGSH